MSETRSFCPSCGEPVEPTEGAGTRRERALCDACYLDRFDLVDAPDGVDLTVCVSCGAVQHDGEWEDVGERDYTEVAIEAVGETLSVHADATDVSWTVDPEQVDQSALRLHCHVSGTLRGRALDKTVVIPVTVFKGSCSRCGRIAGDYWASVVQVRAEDRRPTDEEVREAVAIARSYVGDRAESGDRDAFISEIDESVGGVDLKLSTNQLGRTVSDRIVRHLGGRATDSQTLVTEDGDGNEVYRVTFAVRLPRFRPGDVFDPGDDEGPVLVERSHEIVRGVRLTTGETYETDETAGATRLGHASNAVETSVVTVEDDHAVQVLDPETYAPTTVARPSYLDPDAGRVQVIQSRAGLHVLPDDASEATETAGRSAGPGADGPSDE